MRYIWLIPILPFCGFLINGIFGRRMPKALVRKARATSGARSNTELIEMALANLAVANLYPDWLLAEQGTVGKEVDLEF